MKRFFFFAILAAFSVMASAQTKVFLSIGSHSMTATLVDNPATAKLIELLRTAPITIRMSDYGGFEKVGELPQSFPTSNTQITTVPGDIMLYQGNKLVIFYGTNSWSYTRIGKIDGATVSNLKQFLGNGEISLTLSLDTSSGIETLTIDRDEKYIIYDLTGKPVTQKPLTPGIYIINGEKTIVR